MRAPAAAVVIIALSWFAAAPARAQAPGAAPASPPAASPPAASPLALVAELGSRSGAAVGAEARAGSFGARLTGGGNLIVLSVTDAETHELDSFHVFATGQVNGEVFAFPIRLDGSAELGLSVGGRYNTLLGAGYGVGLAAQRRVGERSTLRASIGFTYFPDGEDRLVEREDFAEDVDFNFPLGARLQGGLDISLAYDLL